MERYALSVRDAALERIGTPPRWLPIELAPTDGTELLLTRWTPENGYGHVDFGAWGYIENHDTTGEPIYGWLSNYGNIDEPTHFINLAAPGVPADITASERGDLFKRATELCRQLEASETGIPALLDGTPNIVGVILAAWANPPAISQMDGAAVNARDWVEDAPHENGNYQCLCSTCGYTFIGHKRRVTCKACAATTASASEDLECLIADLPGYAPDRSGLNMEQHSDGLYVLRSDVQEAISRTQASNREAVPLPAWAASAFREIAASAASNGNSYIKLLAEDALAQQGASHAANAGEDAERAGWEAAAKAISERAAGHDRMGNWTEADECRQCASMLHDMKPARAAIASSAAQEKKNAD
jgi:hypothetical protein